MVKRVTVLAAAALGAAMLLLVAAGPAVAHVSVDAPGATKGGYAVLTFRVPNEDAKASTTALTVSLPADTPIASVSVQPHGGWSFTTKTTKLTKPVTTDDGPVSEAITQVAWTADSAAAAIKPGEFDEFRISAGPLPNVATLTLPTLQTYSDGTVVRWIETPAPGSGAEPQHPAPVVTLAAAAAATSAAEHDGGDGNGGQTALSIVALALAAAALSIAVVTRAKVRGGQE